MNSTQVLGIQQGCRRVLHYKWMPIFKLTQEFLLHSYILLLVAPAEVSPNIQRLLNMESYKQIRLDMLDSYREVWFLFNPAILQKIEGILKKIWEISKFDQGTKINSTRSSQIKWPATI